MRGRGVATAVRGGLRSNNARGGKGSGEGAGDALMVALRGDEAIHDPGGCREGGGGDGFGVQTCHAVIASVSDDLRACQAAVFCFRDIGRKPGSVLFLQLVHPKTLRRKANAHRLKFGGGHGWVGWCRIQATPTRWSAGQCHS